MLSSRRQETDLNNEGRRRAENRGNRGKRHHYDLILREDARVSLEAITRVQGRMFNKQMTRAT